MLVLSGIFCYVSDTIILQSCDRVGTDFTTPVSKDKKSDVSLEAAKQKFMKTVPERGNMEETTVMPVVTVVMVSAINDDYFRGKMTFPVSSMDFESYAALASLQVLGIQMHIKYDPAMKVRTLNSLSTVMRVIPSGIVRGPGPGRPKMRGSARMQ